MKMRGSDLVILGLGGHARVVASIGKDVGYRIRGLVDVLGAPETSEAYGYPVLGGLSSLTTLREFCVAAGIGNNSRRGTVMREALAILPDVKFVTLVHSRALCEEGVTMGEQAVVAMGAHLCAAVHVSDGAVVNTAAIIDHECHLGRYCHIGPGVRLGGRVEVGEFAHVGIGATVIDKIRIGAHSIIGAGAVVISDVPDRATVVGVPAKVIKLDGKTLKSS